MSTASVAFALKHSTWFGVLGKLAIELASTRASEESSSPALLTHRAAPACGRAASAYGQGPHVRLMCGSLTVATHSRCPLAPACVRATLASCAARSPVATQAPSRSVYANFDESIGDAARVVDRVTAATVGARPSTWALRGRMGKTPHCVASVSECILHRLKLNASVVASAALTATMSRLVVVDKRTAPKVSCGCGWAKPRICRPSKSDGSACWAQCCARFHSGAGKRKQPLGKREGALGGKGRGLRGAWAPTQQKKDGFGLART